MRQTSEIYRQMRSGFSLNSKHASFYRWTRSAMLLCVAALVMLFAVSIAWSSPQSAGPVSAKSQTAESAKSPAYLSQAETLLNQGALDDAKKETLQQIELHPSSAASYRLLGIICIGQKDFPSAMEAFEHALKLEPNSAGTRNDLGNVYLAQQKPELAEKEFRKALLLEPANRDANFNLGLVLMATGKSAEAIAYFQRVRPADVPTRFNLVRAYLRAGKTAEGLNLAKDISIRNPDDVSLHATLGVLLASEKQWSAAQFELEKANALQPETFEILYNLGQTYYRERELAKAESVLNRALKIKPDSPETLYLLAQMSSDQSKAADALDLLVRAHKLAPENTDIIFLLARVSMSQNYFEDAIPLLQSGVKIAPRRADLRAALGESYFMSGEAGKSIEEFQKLIELDPSAHSYAFMGLSYRHLGRFDEAKKYFQLGLKQDPHNASCLFNLGFIEERQGNNPAAELMIQQSLRAKPDYSEALLELANIRIVAKRYEEAAELLRRYVKVSRDAAPGYYKLAMVERNLHQIEAAQRDLQTFQSLSKESPAGPYPYQHLFDYVDNRASLAPQAKVEQDLGHLQEQIQQHPGQPHDLYLLAEAYLKLGKLDEARQAVAQIDQLAPDDYRTQAGVGVLLARWRLYPDAIPHFQKALAANPDSDDVKFDLTDAYFRSGQYSKALEASQQVSPAGRQDDTYLSLLADIYAHLGDTAKAAQIFEDAITRNPDNDQYYLSLALVEMRQNNIPAAEKTLQRGLVRIPNSGKILWGLGLVSMVEGNTPQAAERFERAVDLLPEWPGSYSTLGIFYFQTGQIAKAREVLNRFKGSNAAGGFDLTRIEEVLSKAPAKPAAERDPMPLVARQQLLQVALSLADRTL
jgi:tetratricopeptide (TPR) repeat protein